MQSVLKNMHTIYAIISVLASWSNFYSFLSRSLQKTLYSPNWWNNNGRSEYIYDVILLFNSVIQFSYLIENI